MHLIQDVYTKRTCTLAKTNSLQKYTKVLLLRTVSVIALVVLDLTFWAESAAAGRQSLNCAYNYTPTLGSPPSRTKRSRAQTAFQLEINDGSLNPDFCDKVIWHTATRDHHIVFCESTDRAAKVFHDVILQKGSGDVITTISFYANEKIVSKVSHIGSCEDN